MAITVVKVEDLESYVGKELGCLLYTSDAADEE